MFANRLFHVLIALALVIVIVLTVQEAAATASIMSQTDSSKGVRTLECASLPSRHSLHTVYMKEFRRSLTYTEGGSTGVDGGLLYLLSSYRTCSG